MDEMIILSIQLQSLMLAITRSAARQSKADWYSNAQIRLMWIYATAFSHCTKIDRRCLLAINFPVSNQFVHAIQWLAIQWLISHLNQQIAKPRRRISLQSINVQSKHFSSAQSQLIKQLRWLELQSMREILQSQLTEMSDNVNSVIH
jgi:hypothetical protein